MYCKHIAIRIDKMKKILSTFLLITILMQLFSFPVFASGETVRGKEEVQFLRELDIIGTWEPTELITRAEFINAAMRCVVSGSGSRDSSTIAKSAGAPFSDVAPDYWAAYNIMMAKESGIIAGTQTGAFNPEGYLSYSAALKIAINVLDYTAVAEQFGGFPAGYLIAANEIEIDLPYVENNNAMTKGEAAILLKNMLETAPMEQIYGSKDEEFVMPGKDADTLLNNSCGIRSFTGIVTANHYSSVDSTKTVDEGMVKIKSLSNGKTALFDVCDTKAADYLGRSITVYYHDNTPYKLFYIAPDDRDVLIIDAKDILLADYAKKEIEYTYIKEKTDWEIKTAERSVTISSDADIIHNGIFTSDVKKIFDIINDKTQENIDTIEFYNNDSDSKFDVVKVNSYYPLHIDYVYDDDERLVITDNSLGKTVSIDKTDTNCFVKRYTADGYNIDGYGIIEGDTVSVSYAKGDAKIYNLYINKTSDTDIIREINDTDLVSETYTYNFSNALLEHLGRKNVSSAVKIGTEYDLYFDHKGLVAGFYTKSAGYDNYYTIIRDKDEFIYILDTDVEENPLKGNRILFNTVNLEAEINIMTSADKLIVDGKTVGNGSKAGMSVEDARTLLKGRLVKYTKDANGLIKSITLPLEQTEDNAFSYTVALKQSDGPVELKYRASPKTFFKDGVGTCSITSNTTILWVPHNDLVDEGVDVNLYCKRGTTSDFTSDQYYNINTYKVNNTSVTADILIAYNKNEYRIDSFTRPIIVRDVRYATNKYGNPGMKIYGQQDDKEVEIASEDPVFKDRYGNVVNVGVGDLIRCGFNVKGDCTLVNILFDYSDYEEVTASYSSGYRAMKGSIYQHDANAMLMVKNKWDITDEDIVPSQLESQVCTSSAKIYLFDIETQTITKVSSGSLVDYKYDNVNYSRVVVANSYASPDLIIIYK